MLFALREFTQLALTELDEEYQVVSLLRELLRLKLLRGDELVDARFEDGREHLVCVGHVNPSKWLRSVGLQGAPLSHEQDDLSSGDD